MVQKTMHSIRSSASWPARSTPRIELDTFPFCQTQGVVRRGFETVWLSLFTFACGRGRYERTQEGTDGGRRPASASSSADAHFGGRASRQDHCFYMSKNSPGSLRKIAEHLAESRCSGASKEPYERTGYTVRKAGTAG